MNNKLTKTQMKVIEKCSNNYLKILYVTDFLFNKDLTRDGFYATLKETNKTNNINVKMFYLYLTCKFNLKYKLPFLDDTISSISLSYAEENEVDNLNFINIYSYKNKNHDEDSNDNMKTSRIKEKIKRRRRS